MKKRVVLFYNQIILLPKTNQAASETKAEQQEKLFESNNKRNVKNK